MEALLVLILIVVMLVFFGLRRILFGDHKLLKNKANVMELLTGSVQNSMISNPSHLIGKIGEVYTVLKPSGKVMIDEEQYEATTSGEYIEKGIKVKVIGKGLSNVLKVKVAKEKEISSHAQEIKKQDTTE